MLKIRQSWYLLIIIMGIPMLVIWHLYFKAAPCWHPNIAKQIVTVSRDCVCPLLIHTAHTEGFPLQSRPALQYYLWYKPISQGLLLSSYIITCCSVPHFTFILKNLLLFIFPHDYVWKWRIVWLYREEIYCSSSLYWCTVFVNWSGSSGVGVTKAVLINFSVSEIH